MTCMPCGIALLSNDVVSGDHPFGDLFDVCVRSLLCYSQISVTIPSCQGDSPMHVQTGTNLSQRSVSDDVCGYWNPFDLEQVS